MWVHVGQTVDSTYKVNENLDDVEAAWEAQAANKTATWAVYPAMFAAIYSGEIPKDSQIFKDLVNIAFTLACNAQMIDDYMELLCLGSDDKLLLGEKQDVSVNCY